jgi:hypothetical protein
MVWGPWTVVGSHLGSISFEVEYSALGDTMVMGEIRYFRGPDAGVQVVEGFRDAVTVTTSNSVANIEARFKGVPTGSAVDINVTP